jgi:hypothetical protein
MNVPVDANAVVVNSIGELASPPTGGVTDCGRMMPIPVGAFPTQEAEKVTGELNPPTLLTTMLLSPFSPGITDTVSVEGVTEKSVGGVKTGASTAGVPAIVTNTWVE